MSLLTQLLPFFVINLKSTVRHISLVFEYLRYSIMVSVVHEPLVALLDLRARA